MEGNVDPGPSVRFARAMLMDPELPEETARELVGAIREAVGHFRRERPREYEVEDYVRRTRGMGPTSGWDLLDHTLARVAPSERDAWFVGVILSGIAEGLARARNRVSPNVGDVREAKEILCDYWPKCTKMRLEAAVQSASLLAIHRDSLLHGG